jgi:hypothetical protein
VVHLVRRISAVGVSREGGERHVHFALPGLC